MTRHSVRPRMIICVRVSAPGPARAPAVTRDPAHWHRAGGGGSEGSIIIRNFFESPDRPGTGVRVPTTT